MGDSFLDQSSERSEQAYADARRAAEGVQARVAQDENGRDISERNQDERDLIAAGLQMNAAALAHARVEIDRQLRDGRITEAQAAAADESLNDFFRREAETMTDTVRAAVASDTVTDLNFSEELPNYLRAANPTNRNRDNDSVIERR
jgi:hypothetical protein